METTDIKKRNLFLKAGKQLIALWCVPPILHIINIQEWFLLLHPVLTDIWDHVKLLYNPELKIAFNSENDQEKNTK